VSDPAVMTEAFGGAIYEGETFTFPLNAQEWAGYANMNTELYPFNFVDGGYLSFTGSVPSGDAVDVRFRFEYMPYPDVDPAYDTQSVNVSGAIADTYNIVIPSQGAKSFSSLIMYVEGRDIPVTISNIVVTSFGDAGANQDADDSGADQDSEETQDVEKYALANPTNVNNGSNAIGSIVTDTELSKDVVELEVLASNNFEQGYVGFPFQREDFTTASKFEFKVLDQQGSNTVYITLIDAAGARWSSWSSDSTKSVLNTWTTIEFDYSAAASVINLTQVAEVRFAEWNSGSYRFADLVRL
jgi:hypothetical protein